MVRAIGVSDGRIRGTSSTELALSSETRQRILLAELCRTWGRQVAGPRAGSLPEGKALPIQRAIATPGSGIPDSPVSGVLLSPRHQQTLDLLLAGDAEKQIASKLGLSRHTVHDYVKAVYRRFGVNSRGELLALWVRK